MAGPIRVIASAVVAVVLQVTPEAAVETLVGAFTWRTMTPCLLQSRASTIVGIIVGIVPLLLHVVIGCLGVMYAMMKLLQALKAIRLMSFRTMGLLLLPWLKIMREWIDLELEKLFVSSVGPDKIRKGVNAYNATSGSVNITARNATCGWNNQEDRFIALNVDSAAWVEGKITVIVKNAACASQVPSSPRITA